MPSTAPDRRWVLPLVLMAFGLAVMGRSWWLARPRPPPTTAALTPLPAAAPTLGAEAPTGRELHVPRASGAIVVDGDVDEEAWTTAARTGAFVDERGAIARPYSDARLLWGDGRLFLTLYAADEDIRATQKGDDAPLWLDDAFHLSFGRSGTFRFVDVSPLGQVTDAIALPGLAPEYAWRAEAEVGVEHDGTPNDSLDDDEEWVVEMAIPLTALGSTATSGQRLDLSAHRCDTPHGGARMCGAFGEDERVVLVLDP